MLTTKAAIVAFIMSTAPQYGIDPDLAIAIAEVESNFDSNATSHAGAVGVMQIMPQFHPQYTIDELRSPKTNIKVGLKLLRQFKESCIHQEGLTWLICYNYGPKNAKKVRFPHQFPYVKKVNEVLRRIKSEKALTKPPITCLATN